MSLIEIIVAVILIFIIIYFISKGLIIPGWRCCSIFVGSPANQILCGLIAEGKTVYFEIKKENIPNDPGNVAIFVVVIEKENGLEKKRENIFVSNLYVKGNASLVKFGNFLFRPLLENPESSSLITQGFMEVFEIEVREIE